MIALCAFYIATRGPLAHPGWTAEGLVTVILTATTVVLAALGIAVAIMAIWGYDRIKGAAIAGAQTAAETAARITATAVAKETAEVVAAREVAARFEARDTVDGGDIAAAFARNGEE